MTRDRGQVEAELTDILMIAEPLCRPLKRTVLPEKWGRSMRRG
jgi:hypothetical protein